MAVLFFSALTTKKQTTKFSSANFQKKNNKKKKNTKNMLSSGYIIFRIQRLEGSVDLDEVDHYDYEPPHQDLLFYSILSHNLGRSSGHHR